MESEDAEAIKQASDELMKASHKLAETVYAQSAGGAGRRRCRGTTGSTEET